MLRALLKQKRIHRYHKLVPHSCNICAQQCHTTLAVWYQRKEVRYHEKCVVRLIDSVRNLTLAQLVTLVVNTSWISTKLLLEQILLVAQQDAELEQNKYAGSSK